MKKLFILAAAIIALASCSNNEQSTYVEDGSIKFTTMETRTVVSDLSTLKTNGFTVLGFAGTTKIFDNEKATPQTDATKGDWWEMSTKKYWADNTTYNFFALYSSSSSAEYKFTAAEDLGSASFNFTNTGEDDLILAGTNIVTTTGTDGAGRGAAHMTFKHALSRVAFKFVNAYTGDANNKISLAVSDLKLLKQAGTADVTITSTTLGEVKDENSNNIPDLGSSESKITWGAFSSSGDISYMVDGEFTGAGAIAQTANAQTDYKYIVPATNGTYNIACKIVATDGDGNVIRTFDYSEGTLVKTSSAETLTHEAGKSYLYTMTVSEDLNEITFTVDVEEWAATEEEDIVFPK